MGFDAGAVVPHFGDPAAEALACRTAAALFDFSFMARARVEGEGALAALASVTRRNLDDLAQGRIRYALREDGDGHLKSDLTVWSTGPASWELMSGMRSDIADVVAAAAAGTACDLSDETAILAVQGPAALDALGPLMSERQSELLTGLKYYACGFFEIAGVDCLVGRLGYTGERGFEIICSSSAKAALWDALSRRARPAGFIAGDALRIEAGFVLFANEFSLPVTATDCGLQAFQPGASAWDGPAISADGARRYDLVAFVADTDANVALFRPREGLALPDRPGEIAVTSACRSIMAGGILGLGFKLSGADPGNALTDPSGVFRSVRAVGHPFYDPLKLRPRGNWRRQGRSGNAT
ncbi:MAG: hypothetical protein AB7E80_15405 [Hyphomicrobiaceae bacterium]